MSTLTDLVYLLVYIPEKREMNLTVCKKKNMKKKTRYSDEFIYLELIQSIFKIDINSNWLGLLIGIYIYQQVNKYI